jgi:hypothetical protein
MIWLGITHCHRVFVFVVFTFAFATIFVSVIVMHARFIWDAVRPINTHVFEARIKERHTITGHFSGTVILVVHGHTAILVSIRKGGATHYQRDLGDGSKLRGSQKLRTR